MNRVYAFFGCFMIATAWAAGQEGASLAWTSSDPPIVQARELLSRGEFAQAEQLLKPVGTEASTQMLEIIRRLRREYGLDEAGLLEKLRKSIPDVTADDLNRWRQAGQVQHRIIDGKIAYFRREPSNIFRFCDEAKKRRKPVIEQDKWKLTDHLAKVIAEGEKSDSPAVAPVRTRVTFTITIPPDAPGAKPGSVARIWMPYSQEFRQSKDVKLISSTPQPTKIADNGVPHRSLYYELKIADPAKPTEVKAVYEYTCYSWYPKLSDEQAKPLPSSWGDPYLTERPPHILFTPELKKLVAEVVGDETNPLARARKIFFWIDKNIRYCAEMEYCVIPSVTEKVLATRQGDCGVQAILFITMCRAAGVPARWQSGWQTKPFDNNMHDWAEFYVEPWGWLPADPSYGLQKSDDPKVREFYFGHQDSYRLFANFDYGQPLVPPKTSLRSEPADFQRGEVEIDGQNLYFNEWDHDFAVEYLND